MQVENHFQRGDDIGCHSVNHNDVRTAERLQFEAGQQKENLINNGHVARDQVISEILFVLRVCVLACLSSKMTKLGLGEGADGYLGLLMRDRQDMQARKQWR